MPSRHRITRPVPPPPCGFSCREPRHGLLSLLSESLLQTPTTPRGAAEPDPLRPAIVPLALGPFAAIALAAWALVQISRYYAIRAFGSVLYPVGLGYLLRLRRDRVRSITWTNRRFLHVFCPLWHEVETEKEA